MDSEMNDCPGRTPPLWTSPGIWTGVWQKSSDKNWNIIFYQAKSMSYLFYSNWLCRNPWAGVFSWLGSVSLFLWLGHEPSWSQYLGWLVTWFQHKFQNKQSLSKRQSLQLLDSLLIMHHASCMTQRKPPQNWRRPQKWRRPQNCRQPQKWRWPQKSRRPRK